MRIIRQAARVLIVSLLCAVSFGAATPVAAQSTGKRIVVNLAQQRIYAYQGNTLVLSAPVNARGTRRGSFRVQNKIPMAQSIYRGWRLAHWMGIYYVGRVQNGIHGPEYLRGGGVAYVSLGCVVIRSADLAARLYRWAYVGTPVRII